MTETNSQFYRELQKDAERFAQEAMKILVSLQGKETVAIQKDELDLSTSADITAEKYIIDAIRKKYPKHGIDSEEAGEFSGTEPYRWVIDPLDETKEYVRGLKEFNCLIGVEEDTHIVAGASNCYGTNELYSASKGNGATCNTVQLHVSSQKNLVNAFIGYSLPNRKLEELEIRHGLSLLNHFIHHVYRVRGFWDHAKSLGWLARGALDGIILLPQTYKWPDIASSVILVKEAGGTITDWHGNEVTEKTNQNGVVASNGILHGELLKIVNQTKEEV